MLELFEGVIKFDPKLLALNCVLIFLFFRGWWVYYKKTGRNISFWYYMMFMYYFVPILFMYPFVSSELNFISVGSENISNIEKHSTEAYLTTLLGFTGVFLAKKTIEKNIIIGLLETPLRILHNSLGLLFRKSAKSSFASHTIGISIVFIFSAFLLFTISNGFIADPRPFFMKNAIYRPIYNFIVSVYGLILLIFGARLMKYDFFVDKLIFLLLVVFGFFLGARAPLILQIGSIFILFIIYKKNGYVSLFKLALFSLITLLLIIGISILRRSAAVPEGDLTNNTLLVFATEIFYGNTFSDLRDFSWVIGYWDRERYYGLTYISAFLSFIPSALFEFREKYGIGKITVTILGMDTSVHAGVRPGIFGEMYLNFGLIGVLLFGYVWGYVVKRTDTIIFECKQNSNVIRGVSALVCSHFLGYISTSAGFFSFYCILLLLLLSYPLTKYKFENV
jgi:oligosaccharide repeat unit polymerase